MNKVFLIIGMSFILLFVGFSAVDISEANDVINACKHKDEGMVRIVDDHSYCRPSEVPVTWSSTGTAGPEGPEGPEGPQGPEGPPGAGGSLDPTSLYVVACTGGTQCACDDGDTLLNGGAGCPEGSALVSSGPESTQLDGELVPVNIWGARCKNTAGDAIEPYALAVTCASNQ